MKDEKAEVYIRVLDDNHRVCIPIQVRQEMEVSPGCSIEFLADGDRIILRKYGQEVSSIFWTVCGKFMISGETGLLRLLELDDPVLWAIIAA